MFDIVELNSKLVGELREIARDLGVQKVEKLLKQDLIYKILDQQALIPEKNEKKPEMQRQEKNDRNKRVRINKEPEKKADSFRKTEPPKPEIPIEPQTVEAVKEDRPQFRDKPQKKFERPFKRPAERKDQVPKLTLLDDELITAAAEPYNEDPEIISEPLAAVQPFTSEPDNSAEESVIPAQVQKEQYSKENNNGRDNNRDYPRDQAQMRDQNRENPNKFKKREEYSFEFDGIVSAEGVLEILPDTTPII
jgi:transcription termination factor Rho